MGKDKGHGGERKVTACSGVTGKLVTVRHAIEADEPFIRQRLERCGFDPSIPVDPEEYAVAEEDGRILGLGALRCLGSEDTYVGVFIDRGQEFLVEVIAKHLAEYVR